MRLLIVVLGLSVAVVTAVPTYTQKIIGGSSATISQYPEIVSLLYSYWGSGFYQACAGTILNARSILTAAHCVAGDSPSQWRIRAGSSYSGSGGTVYNIATIIYHTNYSKPITFDNDVAILRASSNIAYNSVVKAASIAGTNYYLADNQIVWAAGWGTTSVGGSTVEQLRHVQIWSINADVCKSRYARSGYIITDNMLCSGWLDVGGRDQCQGDSGGPLFHNGVVVGICSWGLQCALAEYPGVNTRVSRFTTWIQANA
ncbi:trypsin, alkaline A isoform X1 [Amyelois transitella]|uniref:trypsin, alkaline A isoform X1 n=1 Tax=Amyelois transitella TaxID=680683 RepID=UPI00067AE1C2|nr:trypsin, alkaline A isoform X1 [Amyelois transitella]